MNKILIKILYVQDINNFKKNYMNKIILIYEQLKNMSCCQKDLNNKSNKFLTCLLSNI